MGLEGYKGTMAYIYQATRRFVLDVIFTAVYSLWDEVCSSFDLKHIAPCSRVGTELQIMLEEAVVNWSKVISRSFL
jgi:hypothetical protein